MSQSTTVKQSEIKDFLVLFMDPISYYLKSVGYSDKIIEYTEIMYMTTIANAACLFDICRETFSREIAAEYKKIFKINSYSLTEFYERINEVKMKQFIEMGEYKRTNPQKLRIHFVEEILNSKSSISLSYNDKLGKFQNFLIEEFSRIINQDGDDFNLSQAKFVGKLALTVDATEYYN